MIFKFIIENTKIGKLVKSFSNNILNIGEICWKFRMSEKRLLN